MNLALVKTIGTNAGKIAVKTGMKLRKASPELMLAGGLIAGVGAIVLACAATKKAEAAVEETHKELDAIQEDNPKEEKKQSIRVYWHLVWKMAEIYGPAAVCLIIAVGLILGSHGILKSRYVSTTLAYKALDEAFKDYRERIQDAVGKEKELHFFNGTEEGGEETVIDENGEEHTVKKAVKVKDKKDSPYEFDFNATTAPGNWEANSDYNLMFLRGIENYLNDLLHARGHVFMNEALDALGIKRTPEGAVVGWILGRGDDYIDLGFSEYYTDEYSDVQDGYLKNIHLNMNVDGLIWNLI